jgi:hypothetical protein
VLVHGKTLCFEITHSRKHLRLRATVFLLMFSFKSTLVRYIPISNFLLFREIEVISNLKDTHVMTFYQVRFCK